MSPNPSKQKGNRLERAVVNALKEHEVKATRSWGSDGRSLGLSPEVDIIIEYLLNKELSRTMKVQCKVRKNIAQYLLPPDDCDITLLKEDRGEIYATIRYKDLLELIQLTFQLD